MRSLYVFSCTCSNDEEDVEIMWRRCGECKPGDIDQDLNGNGRYNVQWYAVPCNVGNSTLRYNVVLHTHWILAIVVSNHRCGI